MPFLLSTIAENWITILFTTLAIFAYYIYKSLVQFKNAGIPESQTMLNTIHSLIFFKQSIGDATKSVYNEMKSKGAKFAGCFMPFPVFIPIDPDLIKAVMQKDFNHFVNRGVYFNEENDPLSAHLFSIEDAKWKNLRAKLTPTFTSGKMKMMFSTVLHTNNQMKSVLDRVKEGDSFEIKDVMLRLNSDIIGSCAFGIDISSLKDPNVPFRQYTKKIFNFQFKDNIKLMFSTSWPNLARKLGIATLDKESADFYLNLIKDTVAYREKENIYRKDFMHLLIQLKNKGRLSDDESLIATDEEKQGMTLNELAAQAFVFFLAGFETSSSVISYTLYELSLHPEIQEKVRQEVKRITEKHGGEITYDAIMEMNYMEMVVNEAIRKYPTLPILNRLVTTDYKIPDTDIILKKGTKVFIPSKGLHHDPEYYPNPEKYDPERFSEENKAKRHPFTFLPFGEGPRVCIGLRFGMLQTKVALSVLLRNYQFSLDPKTSVPLMADPKQFLTVPLGGIWVNIKHITDRKSVV